MPPAAVAVKMESAAFLPQRKDCAIGARIVRIGLGTEL